MDHFVKARRDSRPDCRRLLSPGVARRLKNKKRNFLFHVLSIRNRARPHLTYLWLSQAIAVYCGRIKIDKKIFKTLFNEDRTITSEHSPPKSSTSKQINTNRVSRNSTK